MSDMPDGGERKMQNMICAEELAYREIKRGIVDGRWSAGTRLVHRKLAQKFGISPVPLVLALRMLERDGLVINRPGLGAYVRMWTRDEIIDLYHIRAFQEALAARLCAQRATPSDRFSISAAAKAFAEATLAQDTELHIQADVDFHMAIVRGAHCPDLERNIDNLSIMHCCMRAFCTSLGVPRLVTPAVKGVHEPIVDAIMRHDPDSAEQLSRQHVEDSLTRNLNMIEKVDKVLRKAEQGKRTAMVHSTMVMA